MDESKKRSWRKASSRLCPTCKASVSRARWQKHQRSHRRLDVTTKPGGRGIGRSGTGAGHAAIRLIQVRSSVRQLVNRLYPYASMGLSMAATRGISRQMFPHISNEIREACTTTLQLVLQRVGREVRETIRLRHHGSPLVAAARRQPGAAESVGGSAFVPPSERDVLAARVGREPSSQFTPELVMNLEAEEFCSDFLLEDRQGSERAPPSAGEVGVAAETSSLQTVEQEVNIQPSTAVAERIARRYRIKKSRWRRPESPDRPVLIPPLPPVVDCRRVVQGGGVLQTATASDSALGGGEGLAGQRGAALLIPIERHSPKREDLRRRRERSRSRSGGRDGRNQHCRYYAPDPRRPQGQRRRESRPEHPARRSRSQHRQRDQHNTRSRSKSSRRDGESQRSRYRVPDPRRPPGQRRRESYPERSAGSGSQNRQYGQGGDFDSELLEAIRRGTRLLQSRSRLH